MWLLTIRSPNTPPREHILKPGKTTIGRKAENDIPITENCPLRPVSPYAVSKVGEDMLGYMYFQAYKLKIIRTRMFTHTGPRRGDVFAVAFGLVGQSGAEHRPGQFQTRMGNEPRRCSALRNKLKLELQRASR